MESVVFRLQGGPKAPLTILVIDLMELYFSYRLRRR